MGYYSYFTLTVLQNSEEVEEDIRKGLVAKFQKYSEIADYCLDEDGDPAMSTKWYYAEVDLLAFSRHHPEYLFMLEREGEHTCDMERIYAKDGKSYSDSVEITWDDDPEGKLRENKFKPCEQHYWVKHDFETICKYCGEVKNEKPKKRTVS